MERHFHRNWNNIETWGITKQPSKCSFSCYLREYKSTNNVWEKVQNHQCKIQHMKTRKFLLQ